MEKTDFITRLEAAKRKKRESISQVGEELKKLYEMETGKKADYALVL